LEIVIIKEILVQVPVGLNVEVFAAWHQVPGIIIYFWQWR